MFAVLFLCCVQETCSDLNPTGGSFQTPLTCRDGKIQCEMDTHCPAILASVRRECQKGTYTSTPCSLCRHPGVRAPRVSERYVHLHTLLTVPPSWRPCAASVRKVRTPPHPAHCAAILASVRRECQKGTYTSTPCSLSRHPGIRAPEVSERYVYLHILPEEHAILTALNNSLIMVVCENFFLVQSEFRIQKNDQNVFPHITTIKLFTNQSESNVVSFGKFDFNICRKLKVLMWHLLMS